MSTVINQNRLVPKITLMLLTVPSETEYAVLRGQVKPIYKTAEENKLIEVAHKNAIIRTFILFVQTARSVSKYTDAQLYRRANLSMIRLIALQALANNNGTMWSSQLAEWTQTELHNITTLVKRMKQDGLVTTSRNANDKRYINVTLTDKGREVIKQSMPIAREIVDEVMLAITEEDAAQLEKGLRVIRRNTQY